MGDKTGRGKTGDKRRAAAGGGADDHIQAKAQAITKLVPVGVMVLGVDGALQEINPAGLAILGLAQAKDLEGRVLSDFVLMEDRGSFEQAMAQARAGKTVQASIRLRDALGASRWIDASFAPLPGPAAQVDAVLMVARDVTGQRNSEDSVLANEARLRHLTELAADSFWEQDEQLRFTYFSAGFLDKDGSSPDQMLGKQRWEIAHTRVGNVDWAAHEADLAARRPFRGFEYAQVVSGGSYRWVTSNGDPLFDETGRFIGYRGVTRDITKRKRQEEELLRQANYDPLTGLANRNLLRDRLARAMVRSSRSGGITAVLLIDLDGFKHVNDSFGHALGDKVLRVIATRLTESVRAEDTVARLGGDEFVVVLENMADEEAIGSLAGKLLLAIARPIDHAGHEIVFSGSIGISVHPRDSTEADVLIRNADSAMYEAKSRGRDRFHFYTEELNERAVRYLSLVGNLRKALAENQFWLSYQPIIDGASGKLRGAEALIRWTNADNEMMMPDDFIPAAEESGLIVPIGDWTLRAACLQIQAWQQAGLPVVPVAVNLSARQFFQKDLAQVIARALAAAGNLDPALLHVEVTESVAMQDAKRTSLQLQEIRELGVDISIDDFGTGYSSLAYLRNFPVRDIKIDRSFVSGLPGDRNNGAIVSAVTSLAHALGLRVVAEGVEQLQQLDFLRDLGCDKVQGYHFSKPMRATAFAEWLGGSTQKAP